MRWRTGVELMSGAGKADRAGLQRDLLASPAVNRWLKRLVPLRGIMHLHGCKSEQIENVLAKLSEFGLTREMPPLARRGKAYLGAVPAEPFWVHRDSGFEEWKRMEFGIVAAFLLRAGYGDDARLRRAVTGYLTDLHRIAKDGVFDIYADDEERATYPPAWRRRSKPMLAQRVLERYYVVKTYDLLALAAAAGVVKTPAVRRKLDAVAAYVLDERVQRFHSGYGYYLQPGKKHAWSWGYAPHLPGYFGCDGLSRRAAIPLIHRLEMLAAFAAGRASCWFGAALAHLDTFRRDDGTWVLPGAYLHNPRSGYAIHGYRMGLDEDPPFSRRRSDVEATFRLLRLHRLANAGSWRQPTPGGKGTRPGSG